MLSKLFPWRREAPEVAFWRWFAENEGRYRNFELCGPEQDGLMRELDRALARVHRGLKYEIGKPDQEGAERELVISADGIRQLFPTVQALVGAAPALPGWKISAFRQPKDLSQISLEIPGVKVSPSDLWFALQPEGDRIGVSIYLSGFDDPTSQPAMLVGFLMLDCALGEYDVEMKVGTIATYTVPEDPVGQSLKPFPQLPEEFAALYQLMHGVGR